MKSIERQWLESVPWESVLSINKALCQAQQTEYTANEKSLAAAQKCWEAAVNKGMTLPEVLAVCRKCFELAPFVFNNGNTFASIAKTIIEESARDLPPLEAQIVRTTVSHYVAGLVGKRELLGILAHFKPAMKSAPAPATQPAVAANSGARSEGSQSSPLQVPPAQAAQASG